jgi:hypothetical protein
MVRNMMHSEEQEETQRAQYSEHKQVTRRHKEPHILKF